MGKKPKDAAPDAAAAPEARAPKSVSKKRRSEDSDALAVPSSGAQVRVRVAVCPTCNGVAEPPGRCLALQTPAEAFCARVSEHSAFFDHLVSLVPARFYLPAEAEPESVRQPRPCPARACRTGEPA
jgi:hypothetical protein